MKTNLRVEKALEFIPSGSRVIDIGCDHGYVLIKGVLDKKIVSGIGVDVSQGPYRQAMKNIKENGLDKIIEIRLGDGLQPIGESEGDVCVIGGMGGRLITRILEVDILKSKSFARLILQPMNSEGILRKFLLNNGWNIINEEILILDRLYLYIVAEKGNMEVDDDFIYDIGPVIAANKVKGKEEYIEEKILKLQRILNNIEKGKDLDDDRRTKIEQLIEKWRKHLGN